MWLAMAGLSALYYLITITHAELQIRPLKPAANNALIQQCIRFYDSEELSDEALLRHMLDGHKSTLLNQALMQYKPGSEEYTAISYTLAYYGIDPAKNIQRMMYAIGRDGITEDRLPDNLATIYTRWRTDAAIRDLLSLVSDGSFAEIIDTNVAELFVHYPRALLKLAATRKKYLRSLSDHLSGDVFTGDDRKPIRNALLKMKRIRDQSVSRAAEYCLHELDHTPSP